MPSKVLLECGLGDAGGTPLDQTRLGTSAGLRAELDIDIDASATFG
ncbi:MAG TPA: hypothetical protein QGF63_13095 [Alphaproteobacteria bacterium]|nr:hypothetical protein [Alphaproteobacteria bacterium]HJM50767.1 hypothetical protein [Alphaproteobacteria bacterium]